jgi:type II secretory pathway pseudopilin PulG
MREKKRIIKRGQVLVEAVIYILIALTLIGVVLAFAYPKIEEIQDKAIIEQSSEMMQDIADTITELRQGGGGNQREIELGIKKGELKINSENDTLVFELKSSYQYSEPGKQYERGNVIILTEEISDYNLITIRLKYEDVFNITYEGTENSKILSKGGIPYKLLFKNTGEAGGIIGIDISL